MIDKKVHDVSAFQEAYSRLNSEQKKAVDAIEGPIMVVAGPGTGKTQILTLRIANILLQTDVTPDNILALTFTESGAKAMRERLRLYIGTAAYQVPIYTFHGFSQMLISQYPEAYTRVIGGRPAGDVEKISLLESILSTGEVKLLRPVGNPLYYVAHIQRIIGQLKQEYITPNHLVELVDDQEKLLQEVEQFHTKGAHKGKVRSEYAKLEKSVAKNRELIYVYRRYEALLSEQSLYDFEDMIVETVRALESNEDMLRDLQEQYQYILADEHQDVNGSQNKILELLASFHNHPNIFAVGDEKQAIYRFQGASLENFLYFTEQFADTEVISLTNNYRSGQRILDAAHSLVKVEEGPLQPLRVPLLAAAVGESDITKREFSHQSVEDEWVVSTIKAEIEGGRKPQDVALILRTNREVEVFAEKLRRAGVPVTASADGDILRHPITRVVQSLIESVLVDQGDTALFTVLHGQYWNIMPADLFRLFSARSYERSLWDLVSNKELLESLGIEGIELITHVKDVISEARKREVQEPPHKVLAFLLQESGLLDHLMIHDPFEGVRVVRRLYDEVEELVRRDEVGSLREIKTMFQTRSSYGLPLNAPFITTNSESVQVMTAHKSKGLEFEVVFVPHVTDGNWGGGSKKTYFDIPLALHAKVDKNDLFEDERRLLYVAMTRAKEKLHFSYSRVNAEGRDLLPSRLLESVTPDLLSQEPTLDEEDKFQPTSSLKHFRKNMFVEPALLTHLLKERGFSATSLNNFLTSPWNYIYRNILRAPEIQPIHMLYGTAVHNTLEYVTRHHTIGGTLPTVSDLKKKLEQELNRLPITTGEYTRLFEEGLSSLASYLEHLQKNLPKVTKEEFSIQVVFETGVPELPEVLLKGKIDRIDIDESGQATRVVDYKTGKPKTRNHIEGKTKDSDGGYKRQLVFYALLLSLYNDERYQCREGVLSFVQPDKQGKVREEAFLITDEEIEDMKCLIREAVKTITSGDILLSPCDDKVCEYCHLVSFLQGRSN